MKADQKQPEAAGLVKLNRCQSMNAASNSESSGHAALRKEDILPFSPLVLVSERRRVIFENLRSTVTSKRQSWTQAAAKSCLLEQAIAQVRLEVQLLPLTGKFKNLKTKIYFLHDQVSAGSVWDTSHPVAATLCKPWTAVLIFLCFLFMTFSFYLTLNRITRSNMQEGNRFQFTVLERRNLSASDSKSEQNPGISDFGLLRDECIVDVSDKSCHVIENTTTLTLSCVDAVKMNGWWFTTIHDSAAYDPIRFRLDVCSGTDCQNWRKIGSSSIIWVWWGAPVLRDGRYNTTLSRGKHVLFDLRIPWLWVTSNLISSIALQGTNLLLLAVLLLQDRMRGIVVLSGSCFTIALLQLLFCAGYLSTSQPALAFFTGGTALFYFGFSTVVAFAESLTRHFCGIAGVGLLFVRILHNMIFLNGEHDWSEEISDFQNPFSMMFLPLLGAWFVAYFTRRQSRIWAHKVIAADVESYGASWKRILDSESASSFEILESFASKLALSPSDAAQYYHHQLIHQIAIMIARPTQKANYYQSVNNLDQLFVQAAGLHPFLRAKVANWAMQINALVPVAGSRPQEISFRRWSDIAKDQVSLRAMQWGQLKTRKRAVEKLFRSYSLEVSRLVDLCRQSLYFGNLDEILQCLKLIAEDPTVELLRVHNRLRPSFDASATAGYRDVLLNLKLRTQDTEALGVHNHVCEVQLVLEEFARFKVCDPTSPIDIPVPIYALAFGFYDLYYLLLVSTFDFEVRSSSNNQFLIQFKSHDGAYSQSSMATARLSPTSP